MLPPTLLSALLATATLSLARTPPGFLPATTTDLIVDYNGTIPLNGIEVPRNTTIPQPRLGTLTRLNGTSYAILMIDLDIPTATPPTTSTLLHWLQTNLRPATTLTRIRSPTTGEELSVFLLENGTSPVAPLVPYFGPNPPARIPLAHRYVHLLVDTSGAEAEDLEVLRERARVGRGFDVGNVLEEADLEGKVVGGTWLVVRNPGPVANATASGTGTGAVGGATGVAVPTGAAGRSMVVGWGVVAVAGVVGGLMVGV